MKIAVIICGIFEYDENILKEIIRCYSLDNMNVDIFIYNNNTIENNDKIVHFFNNNNINTVIVKSEQYSLDKDDNLIIKQFLINEKIKNNWENFKQNCINNNIINNNLLSIHVPFKDPYFFYPKIDSFPQFKQIYLGLNEITKYENNNSFNYDYIMKIRLDFFLKHDKFGPIHYFNDKNDILLKSYNNLKYYYDKIDEDDDYHLTEFRINNYLYWRATKYLGGQYMLNKTSYDKIIDSLDNRDNFNNIIKDKFIITINDFCFFSSGINFKLFFNNLYNNYGEFYSNECKFWWTAESQFLQSILNSELYYFDYLQNNNYFKGREAWVNDYHGIEKYDKLHMKTF
jgi:hypothetical protein